MQYSIVFATIASASYVMAQGLTINTPPSLVECQPSIIQWSGGAAPYFISVLPGNQPSAAPIEQFPQQSGNSFTWNVDIASGTSVTLQVKDATGNTNFSSERVIIAGTSAACVGTGGGAAGGASGASSAPGGAGSTPVAGTPAASTPSTSAPAVTSSSSRPVSTPSAATGPSRSSAAPAGSAAPAASSSSAPTSDATKLGAGFLSVAAAALFAAFA